MLEGTFSNASGAVLTAEQGLDIAVAQQLDNSGRIHAANARLTADQINNATSAVVFAENNLQIASTGVVTNLGSVTAGQNLSLSAQGNINQSGLMQATDGDLALQTSQALNNTGLIGGRNVSISAANLANSADAVFLADEQLSLSASNQFTNAGGIQATDIMVEASQFTNTEDGLMFAEGELQLSSSGTLVNRGSLVAQGLKLHARSLTNTSGGVLLAFGDAHIRVTETLRNASATIEAEGDLRIESGTLRNEREVFEVGTTVTVNQYQNIVIDAPRPYVRGKRTYTETITTHEVIADSPEGRILSGGDMALKVQGTLDNNYSTISSGGSLVAEASILRNQSYVVDNNTVHQGRDGYTKIKIQNPLCGKDGANGGSLTCYFTDYFDYSATTKTTVTLASATFSAQKNLTGGFAELDNGQQVGSMAQSHEASHEGNSENFPLPTSPLVKPSDSPDHPYLVETNPRLTSYKT
ncbi:hypothetical protein P3G55_24580, partial [Leptospira sp. 96542]|nr:hypothetical protein [Leptospira sp. 96542]